MASRNPRIGVAEVLDWSRTLPRGASILDLGCGNGVPISQALINDGFSLYGVDASAKMIAAFRKRFPGALAECAAVEDSGFFGRTFDGVVAWGLLFLLTAELQEILIGRIGRALNRGGTFLFTAPLEAVTWPDALTGRESVSLGREGYKEIFHRQDLTLMGERFDEGNNHYYLVSRT